MDVTVNFKTCLKSAGLQGKTLLAHRKDKNDSITEPKDSPNKFFSEAKKLVEELSKVYQIISKHRQVYFKLDKSSDSKSNQVLFKLDLVVRNVAQNCLEGIRNLKSKTVTTSQQNHEHQQIIIGAVEKYLQFVQKFFVDLKYTHNKKKKMFSELETATLERKNRQVQPEKIPSKIQEMNDEIREVLHYEDKITQEDIQIFETENEQLHNELNTLSEDIKNIESKVTNITELQNFFTEKILGQDKNLENVLTTIVGSTEDVKEANEQIRKAIQRNAGLRVYVLFFLLVMSFTLIFLDWYNV